MPWTAKRKYCGSLPCSKRTKLYVETQFHSNYKPVEQTERKDRTVFGVPNAAKCESAEHVGSREECDKANSQKSNRETAARLKIKEVIGLYEELLSKNLKAMQSEVKGGCGSSSVYMMLAKHLQEKHQWIVTPRRFGSIPGIEIGDRFKYRAELLLVGLHCQFRSGIDYVVENGNMLATSIVHSSRYDNDILECFDVLVYSGHGGNPNVKVGGVLKDQKLQRGNMALRNNIRTRTPVRVIYGSKGQQVPIYTYVGLYSVEEFWRERGPYGKLVFKFVLRRIPGQPQLNLEGKEKIPPLLVNEIELSKGKEKTPLGEVNEIELSKGKEKTSLGEVNEKEKTPLGEVNEIDDLSKGNEKTPLIPLGEVNEIDLSQGKEKIPIRVVNEIDNEEPRPFNYITHMVYPNLRNHSFPRGCKGVDECCDEYGKCYCAAREEGDIPFYKDGRIVRFGPLIYECGPSCKCCCPNRVSQSGIRFQLEVFKSRPKSWGVRSRDYIQCGSFICEYVGEVFEESEVERKVGKEKCLFDIACHDDDDDDDDMIRSEGFTIDATHFGNVARFMGRSNDPNVWAQYVLYDHDDKRMPHVMLFAMKNIPPLQELTYGL